MPKIWEPQPGPQERLLECPASDIFYGGQRGSAKTDGIIGDWLSHFRDYKTNAEGMIIRRTYPELERIVTRTRELYPEVGATWNESKHTWTFPGGTQLKLRHLDRDRDADKYQGHEYTWIAVDEAGSFPSPVPIDKLRGSLRSSAGVPVKMILTGNPGGLGHRWLKTRYVDKCEPGKIYDVFIGHGPGGERREYVMPYGQPCADGEHVGTRCYLQAALKDNPALLKKDPNYINRLKASGSRQLVKAWLEGDWSIDIDGALWQWDDIESNRVAAHPELVYICAALDPSAKETGHEAGMAAAGLGVDGHVYVLDSDGLKGSPQKWAARTVRMYDETGAHVVFYEENQGGEMVREVLHAMRKGLPIKGIRAKKGKALRAEPVALAYEQGRVHHVGRFDELEEQMILFPVSHTSDDRIDALVYAVLGALQGARTGPIIAEVEW